MGLSLPLKNVTFEEMYKEVCKSTANCFYPMGKHHRWHSGVHILTEQSIRAIADGEIVAFRLEDDYFDGNKSGNFVLVKHKMTINDVEAEFFSLYMNLLPARYYFSDDDIPKKLENVIPQKTFPEFIFKRIYNANTKLDAYETFQKISRKFFNSGEEIIFQKESDYKPNGNSINRIDVSRHAGKDPFIDVNKYERVTHAEMQRKYCDKCPRVKQVTKIADIFSYDYAFMMKFKVPSGKLFRLDVMDHSTQIKDAAGKNITIYGLKIRENGSTGSKEIAFISNGSLFKFVNESDFFDTTKSRWLPINLYSIAGNEAVIDDTTKTKYGVGYIYAGDYPGYRWRSVDVETKTAVGSGIDSTNGYWRSDEKVKGKVCVLENTFRIKEGEIVGFPSAEFNGFHFELIFSKDTADALIKGDPDKKRYFYHFNKNNDFSTKIQPVITEQKLYRKEIYKKDINKGASYTLKPETQMLWVPYEELKGDLRPIVYAGTGWNYFCNSKDKFLETTGEVKSDCRSYILKKDDDLYFKAFIDYENADSWIWCVLQEKKYILEGISGVVTVSASKPYGTHRRLPVLIADIDENAGRFPENVWVKDSDIKGCSKTEFSKEQLLHKTDYVEIEKDFNIVYKDDHPYAVDSKPAADLKLLKNETYSVFSFDEIVLSLIPKKVYVWLDYTSAEKAKEADICPFDWIRGTIYKWSPVEKFTADNKIKPEFANHMMILNGTDYYVKGYLDEAKTKYLWCKTGTPGENVDIIYSRAVPAVVRPKNSIRRLMLETANISQNSALYSEMLVSVKYVEAQKYIKMPEITEEIRRSSEVLSMTGDFSSVYNVDPLDENNTIFNTIEKKIADEAVCHDDMSKKMTHKGTEWLGVKIDELSAKEMVWIKQSEADNVKRDASNWSTVYTSENMISKPEIVVDPGDDICGLIEKAGFTEKVMNWLTTDSIQGAFSNTAFAAGFKNWVLTSPTEWSEKQWIDKIKKLLMDRDKKPEGEVDNVIKELYKKYYWYDEVRGKIKTLPDPLKVTSFHPVRFIEFSQDFLENRNQAIVSYFKSLVIERSGAAMWKNDGVNVVAIRHLGEKEGEKSARGLRHANDLWILIIDDKVKAFFLANTEPGIIEYEDSAAKGGIACLIPGSYRYEPHISTKKHREDYADNPTRLSGFCQPEAKFPVWRDPAGLFDASKRIVSGNLGQGLQLHWMGAIGNNLINGYSAGCQGIKGDFFIDENGDLKHFKDTKYKILPLIQNHGSWALFMKMVDERVFSWKPGKNDIDGILKADQGYLHYHLFDEDSDKIDPNVIDRAKYVKEMIEANAK